ncbi:MAG: hypothetical protein GY822_02420 [Deltaproteobacteria bacterium]|nr:hypothetical protein [Deltaproteobacteria bacterium]
MHKFCTKRSEPDEKPHEEAHETSCTQEHFENRAIGSGPFFLNASATHIQLPNAPKTASLDEREEFYDEYSPLSFHQTNPSAARFLLLKMGFE